MEALLENLTGVMESNAGQSGDVQSFILCMLVAMVFGVLQLLLYNSYYRENEPQDGSLARSLVLLTPGLTATFWIIQSSVILSLGLLGSLSFVRFRTPVKRSEDVTFIIIGISVAISCATMNFLIASVMMLLLFGFTLVRNRWVGKQGAKNRFAIVTFNSKNGVVVADLHKAFKSIEVDAEFISSRSYDGVTSFVFNAPKISSEKHDRMAQALASLDQTASYNIFYPNDRLGV